MNLRTTLFLLLLVLGLAGAIFWQRGQEEKGDHDVVVRLFEGLDPEKVRVIRIDHIERSLNARLERDRSGVWYLTDPIEYPADSGVMRILFQDIADGQAMMVPEEEWGEKELGFDPPTVVLELDEEREEGIKTYRVEVGATDIDRVRVNVRIDGRYLRTLVRLHTTLNREIPDYRSKRAMNLPVQDIVEIHRTGTVLLEVDGEPQDTTVHAFLDGEVWRSTVPYEALLDPLDAGVLMISAAGLVVDRFVETDSPQLSDYGLDRPMMELELRCQNGSKETLQLSRRGNTSEWFVKRKHAPFVWMIEPEKALRMLYPYEALLERHFMRAVRREVTALQLSHRGGGLRLERAAGGWTVAQLVEGAWSAPVPADPQKVEGVVSSLEELEVSRFLLERRFSAAESEYAVHVEAGGSTFGGRLGPLATDEDGNEGRLYQRDGDEVVGLIDPWLAELAESSIDDFRSTALLTVEEVQLSGLVLTRGEQRLVFERDRQGLWHLEGEEDEATELLATLDPLFFLRASEHLTEPGELADPIQVEFLHSKGRVVSFQVGAGTDAEGGARTELVVGEARSVAKIPDLHERLAGLFGD